MGVYHKTGTNVQDNLFPNEEMIVIKLFLKATDTQDSGEQARGFAHRRPPLSRAIRHHCKQRC